MEGRTALRAAVWIGAGAFLFALVALPVRERAGLRGVRGTGEEIREASGRRAVADARCEPSMEVVGLVARMSGVGRMDALVWAELGWAFREAGMEESAAGAWSRARALQEEVVRRSGEEEGDARSGINSPTDWYNLACFRALCGEREWAVAALRRAVRLGWRDAEFARGDRDLASVRELAVFEAALRE